MENAEIDRIFTDRMWRTISFLIVMWYTDCRARVQIGIYEVDWMVVKYQLNQDTYPMISCLHDCVIKKVEIQNEFLIFRFESEINQHDGIQRINQKAKSLVIKYHLIYDFEIFVWRRRLSLTKG